MVVSRVTVFKSRFSALTLARITNIGPPSRPVWVVKYSSLTRIVRGWISEAEMNLQTGRSNKRKRANKLNCLIFNFIGRSPVAGN